MRAPPLRVKIREGRENKMETIGTLAGSILSAPTSSALKQKSESCSELKAAQSTRLIWGQFRRSDTDDPEVFYSATKALLSRYPEAAVIALCDPQHGIAGEQTFLPSIAELRASLDRRMAPILAQRKRDEELARTRRLIDEGKIEHTESEAERVGADAAKFRKEVKPQQQPNEKQRQREAWERTFKDAAADEQQRMLHHLRLDVSPVKIGTELAAKIQRKADAADTKMF